MATPSLVWTLPHSKHDCGTLRRLRHVPPPPLPAFTQTLQHLHPASYTVVDELAYCSVPLLTPYGAPLRIALHLRRRRRVSTNVTCTLCGALTRSALTAFDNLLASAFLPALRRTNARI